MDPNRCVGGQRDRHGAAPRVDDVSAAVQAQQRQRDRAGTGIDVRAACVDIIGSNGAAARVDIQLARLRPLERHVAAAGVDADEIALDLADFHSAGAGVDVEAAAHVPNFDRATSRIDPCVATDVLGGHRSAVRVEIDVRLDVRGVDPTHG